MIMYYFNRNEDFIISKIPEVMYEVLNCNDKHISSKHSHSFVVFETEFRFECDRTSEKSQFKLHLT